MLPMPRSRPKVSLVGAGPGDPGLLTLKAARAIQSADILLYDYLASEATVALAPANCEKLFVGKQAGAHSFSQGAINDLIVAKAREGKRVVRLKGGDPFVFGRGAEEAQELRRAGIDFEIIPGITSAIAAPAYAGIPVTHRAHNTAFTVLTGHEDPAKPESTIDWARFADPHQTLVLLMAMGNLQHIVAELSKHGLPAATPVAVIREGTRPTQETCVATLETIAAEVERRGLGAPAVVVIGDVVGARNEIAWFDNAPLFGKRVLVTRPAQQGLSFAESLLEHGAQPVLAPVIAIGPPDDDAAARSAVEHIGEYQWLVLSSHHAVDALFHHLAAIGKDARYLRAVKIAAIGPKTAASLRRHGIDADLVPDEFLSEGLADALLEQISPHERTLVFRAQEARDVLPGALAAANRSVEIVAAYKTSLVSDPNFARKVESADILTFTSASTVSGYVQNLGSAAQSAGGGKIVACIGPVTAQAARDAGLHVDVVAAEYTAEGLLDALEGALQSTGSASHR